MTDTNKTQQAKQRITQTFDAVASAYGLGGARFFHSSAQAMSERLRLKGSERLLDVACGTGALSISLAYRVPEGHVMGIDLSTGMLAQAKQRATNESLNNVSFQTADMTALPFDDRYFDHAACAFGLFFVEDMVGLLAHIKSKVKLGGSVTISGFCGNSFMPAAELAVNRLRAYGVDMPEQAAGWKRMAEPEQLRTLFDAAGLENMEVTRQSLGYYTDEKGWWDVLWNAGYRGLIAQLGDRLDDFKKEHFAEIQTLSDDKGLWMEIDVNYTQGWC